MCANGWRNCYYCINTSQCSSTIVAGQIYSCNIATSENTSSRKTFVGGLIKAAHFLTENKTGILVFVIVPKKNTTADSIVNHLKPYYKWIKDKTNLKKVYIIEAKKYYAKEKVLEIATKEFHDNSYAV